jgi:hypothetical protein
VDRPVQNVCCELDRVVVVTNATIDIKHCEHGISGKGRRQLMSCIPGGVAIFNSSNKAPAMSLALEEHKQRSWRDFGIGT